MALLLGGCSRGAEQFLIFGSTFGMMLGASLVLAVANRKMMGHYRVFAERFGLKPHAIKEFGLYKYPWVEGVYRGRTIKVSSNGNLKGFDGRLVHRVTTKLQISVSPRVPPFALARKLTLGAARKVLAQPDIDDQALLRVFEVGPQQAANAVLPLLSQNVRRTLVEHADGMVVADASHLSFRIRQTMMTNAREQRRFESLTYALIELADALEDRPSDASAYT